MFGFGMTEETVKGSTVTPVALGLISDPPTIVLSYDVLTPEKFGKGAKKKRRKRKMPLRDFTDKSNVKRYAFNLRQRHNRYLSGVIEVTLEKMLRIIQEIQKGNAIEISLEIVEKEYSIDPEEDLNKLPPAILSQRKAVMDETFQKNLIKPGHPDYVYDRQISFESIKTGDNDWDEEGGKSITDNNSSVEERDTKLIKKTGDIQLPSSSVEEIKEQTVSRNESPSPNISLSEKRKAETKGAEETNSWLELEVDDDEHDKIQTHETEKDLVLPIVAEKSMRSDNIFEPTVEVKETTDFIDEIEVIESQEKESLFSVEIVKNVATDFDKEQPVHFIDKELDYFAIKNLESEREEENIFSLKDEIVSFDSDASINSERFKIESNCCIKQLQKTQSNHNSESNHAKDESPEKHKSESNYESDRSQHAPSKMGHEFINQKDESHSTPSKSESENDKLDKSQKTSSEPKIEYDHVKDDSLKIPSKPKCESTNSEQGKSQKIQPEDKNSEKFEVTKTLNIPVEEKVCVITKETADTCNKESVETKKVLKDNTISEPHNWNKLNTEESTNTSDLDEILESIECGMGDEVEEDEDFWT